MVNDRKNFSKFREKERAVRTNIALCVGFTFYHSTMSARVGEASLVNRIRYQALAFDKILGRLSSRCNCYGSVSLGEVFLLNLR